MTWARFDDGFPEHPKVIGLSDKAFRLNVAAVCFCSRNLTDGSLAASSVRVVCAVASGATRKHVTELVEAGLWLQTDEGFEVKDFLDYNPPAERVKEDRAKARDRMRRTRGERSQERSGERSPTPGQDPTRPHTAADQSETLVPPEQSRDVAALVDESLGSGLDAVPASPQPRSRDVGTLLELLPAHEVEGNTRSVLERKFALLPPHFVGLAREELIAANGVRSRVRYLNGIADRMIIEVGRPEGVS